jgi:hypothetical protein
MSHVSSGETGGLGGSVEETPGAWPGKDPNPEAWKYTRR